MAHPVSLGSLWSKLYESSIPGSDRFNHPSFIFARDTLLGSYRDDSMKATFSGFIAYAVLVSGLLLFFENRFASSEVVTSLGVAITEERTLRQQDMREIRDRLDSIWQNMPRKVHR